MATIASTAAAAAAITVARPYYKQIQLKTTYNTDAYSRQCCFTPLLLVPLLLLAPVVGTPAGCNPAAI
jgi:hypothetical protein